MRATICRWAHFNAAHRLHNDNWSDEKNKAVFGKCNNPNYHGHNYELEVYLTGEIDPETGYLFDLGELKQIIVEEVEDRYDHKNLNLDCPEYKDINPSAENICIKIYELLRNRIDARYDIKVRLWETSRNSVIYPPES
ncbi:MAG: 6-carboxytetrahydropterin synthase [Saprospiraceae bacterium]|nr:6-carboxytetrahydropterin synthase [Saprospiraceae bacterium]